jgi:hypothetical protein
MDQKENGFNFFVKWLVRAGKQMNDPRYFQLPISGKETPIFRERVYCYELYHQMRDVIDRAFLYKLDGEVDKIREKKLLGYRSRAEFVAESIRDKLIQVKK